LVLWTSDRDGAPTQVASLLLFGNTLHLDGELFLHEPPCLAGQDISLTGDIGSRANPTLHLRPKPGQPAVELTAELKPRQAPYRLKTAPFDAFLALPATCSPVTTLAVKARLYPRLDGKWRLAADPPNAFLSIREALTIQSGTYEPSTQRLTYIASLDLEGAPCAFHGTATSEISGYTSRYSLTFQSADGQTSVFADATIAVLDDRTPIQTRYTIHGGACDGRSFTATLLTH
jgi:hypothetical protein